MPENQTSHGGPPVTAPRTVEFEQTCFVRVHVPPEHVIDYIYGGKRFAVDQLMITWRITDADTRSLDVSMHGLIKRADNTTGKLSLYNRARLRWPVGQEPSVPADTDMPDWVIETVLAKAANQSLVRVEFADVIEALQEHLDSRAR